MNQKLQENPPYDRDSALVEAIPLTCKDPGLLLLFEDEEAKDAEDEVDVDGVGFLRFFTAGAFEERIGFVLPFAFFTTLLGFFAGGFFAADCEEELDDVVMEVVVAVGSLWRLSPLCKADVSSGS